MKQYFAILFLSETSTLKEVKKAYRTLAKKYHPDKNSGSAESTQEFRKIQEAYEIILKYLASKRDQSNYTKSNFTDRKTSQKAEETQSENKKESNFKNQSDKTDSEKQKNNNDFNFEQFEEKTENKTEIKFTHSIGDKIKVGYFEYEILQAQYSKTAGVNFFSVEADGIYLIIEMIVINTTQTQKRLHNYMFRLANLESDYFEYSTKGISAVQMSGIKSIDIFGKDFNPKIPSIVNLIFEVPCKNSFYLNLCGGEYDWDQNSICHCKEIEVVKIS